MKKLGNDVLVTVLLLFLVGVHVYSDQKRPAGSTQKSSPSTPPVLVFDRVRATVLWHKLAGLEIPQGEKLAALNQSIDTDEFSRRKIIAETDAEFLKTRQEIDKIPNYSATIDFKLLEYDFERKGFPTDLTQPEIRIQVARSQVSPGFLSDEIIYYVVLPIPDGTDFISMPESEAEKLANRLRSSRNASAKFWFRTKGYVPRIPKDNYSGEKRGFEGELDRVELFMPEENGLPKKRLKQIAASEAANQ